MSRFLVSAAAALATLTLTSACSDDGGGAAVRPVRIAVTTSVLGDVVGDLFADTDVAVVVVMGPGAEPHEFQPAPADIARMSDADAVVVNGGDFEEGLVDAIDATRADGVPVIEFFPTGDPHQVGDPDRVADAVVDVAAELSAQLPALGDLGIVAAADAVAAELRDLGREVDDILGEIPADRRLLVTDHDVLGPFAVRFGFEIVGVLVTGGSSTGAASGADLADLIDVIEARGVNAIFVGPDPPAVAETVAAETGVGIVPLFTEGLGLPGSGAETYAALMRTNAERIVGALAP